MNIPGENTKEQLQEFFKCLVEKSPKKLAAFLDANPSMKESVVFKQKWFIDGRESKILSELDSKVGLHLYYFFYLFLVEDCEVKTEQLLMLYFRADANTPFIDEDRLTFLAEFLAGKGIINQKISYSQSSSQKKWNGNDYELTLAEHIIEYLGLHVKEGTKIVERKKKILKKYPKINETLLKSFKIISEKGFDFSTECFNRQNVFLYLYDPLKLYTNLKLIERATLPVSVSSFTSQLPDWEPLAEFLLNNGGRGAVLNDRYVRRQRFVQNLLFVCEAAHQISGPNERQVVGGNGKRHSIIKITDNIEERAKEVRAALSDSELWKNPEPPAAFIEECFKVLLGLLQKKNRRVIEDSMLLDAFLNQFASILKNTTCTIRETTDFITKNRSIEVCCEKSELISSECSEVISLGLSILHRHGINPFSKSYSDQLPPERMGELIKTCFCDRTKLGILKAAISSSDDAKYNHYFLLLAALDKTAIQSEVDDWKMRVSILLNAKYAPIPAGSEVSHPELIAHSLMDSLTSNLISATLDHWGLVQSPAPEMRCLSLEEVEVNICEMFVFLSENGVDLSKADPVTGKTLLDKCRTPTGRQVRKGVKKLHDVIKVLSAQNAPEEPGAEIEMEW